jgi:hypothetical protein
VQRVQETENVVRQPGLPGRDPAKFPTFENSAHVAVVQARTPLSDILPVNKMNDSAMPGVETRVPFFASQIERIDRIVTVSKSRVQRIRGVVEGVRVSVAP